MFIEWSHAKPRSTLSIFHLHPASPAERSWLQPSYLEIKITHLTLKAKNAHSFGRSSAGGVSAPTLGVRFLSLCRCACISPHCTPIPGTHCAGRSLRPLLSKRQLTDMMIQRYCPPAHRHWGKSLLLHFPSAMYLLPWDTPQLGQLQPFRTWITCILLSILSRLNGWLTGLIYRKRMKSPVAAARLISCGSADYAR